MASTMSPSYHCHDHNFENQVLVPFPPSGRWHLSLLSHCHMAGQGRRWDTHDYDDDNDNDNEDNNDNNDNSNDGESFFKKIIWDLVPPNITI